MARIPVNRRQFKSSQTPSQRRRRQQRPFNAVIPPRRERIAYVDTRQLRLLEESEDAGGTRWIVSMRPFNVYADQIRQLTMRIVSVVSYASRKFEEMQRRGGRWRLSVILKTPSAMQMLENSLNRPQTRATSRVSAIRSRLVSGKFGIRRIFMTPGETRMYLPASIAQAIENLSTSDTELEVSDITFELRFTRAMIATAMAKHPSYIRKTIANADTTKGLGKYSSVEGLCGFQAIIYYITITPECRQYLENEFAEKFVKGFPPGHIHTDLLRRSPKRFKALAESVKHMLHHFDWIVTPSQGSTAQKFVEKEPKFQVVIYNEVSRTIIECRRGFEFDTRRAKDTTILLSYTLGHIHWIRYPVPYLGYLGHSGTYCYCCHKVFTVEHRCSDFVSEQCVYCLVYFKDQYELALHQKQSPYKVKCLRCDRSFISQECHDAHRCTQVNTKVCGFCEKKMHRGVDHICGMYKCITCKLTVEDGHRCFIQRLPEPKTMTAAEAGENYYAFDLESMLVRTQLPPRKRKRGEPEPEIMWGELHVVNLIVVCRCFSDEQWIFKTLEEFVYWIESIGPAKMFAHNMKGYDGRMVFDYLFEYGKLPQQMLWRGSKIMAMTYGAVEFQDTLLHISASLAQCPKMFGLDEDHFKKGFFPYRFNTPENQNYIGPTPDVSFYEPEMMSPEKRTEFYEWYEQQKGVYDFKKELIEYCVSDTEILARTIEAYMEAHMSHHPMDPFSCKTIASFALKLYRTYYMPENSLGRLGPKEHEDIKRSMHGGRTDTRCMLREWSEQDVASGKYGMYQDVQSLYPTTQFYDELPVGIPTYRSFSDSEQADVNIEEVFGFVCCDIEPTRYLHHPIIVEYDEATGRLLADLLPKKNIVVPTPELHLALQHGYKITHVYWYYHFEKSTDLFKGYITEFLRDKIHSKGMPRGIVTEDEWLEFCRYHLDELGIQLDIEKMMNNPAMNACSKLLLNSLWGKMAENKHYHMWDTFEAEKDQGKLMAMENRWINGELDVTFRKYSTDMQRIGMVYVVHPDMYDSSSFYKREAKGHVNIACASMVTSQSRCRLLKEMLKLGTRVLYHDTDSVIYERDPNGYNIPDGRYLGEWEDETKGVPMIKFASTGPKSYSYVLQNGKSVTKVKGITLNAKNSGLINFEAMKRLVTVPEQKILAECMSFDYDRRQGRMITRRVLKKLVCDYRKGFISKKNFIVFPFGYEAFLPEMREMGLID